MKGSPGRCRIPSRLSASLNQHLNLYALAASAASVSLLALAQPSEAKIIYTKTHQIIGFNGIYGLDLTHDGNVDFVIQQGNYSDRLFAKEAFGNAVEGSAGKSNWAIASALRKGTTIGPSQRFLNSNGPWGEVMAGYSCTESGRCPWSGQWVNVTNRYLGLRFQIKGKTHYGWARLSVQTQGSQITATLTGYAYETIAHKGIRAGQTSGADDGSSSVRPADSAPDPAAPVVKSASQATQPLSLGQLALGARDVPVGRRL